MGLASDSLVMAAEGNKVTALESQEVIFQVVSRGLATYQTDDKQLEKAMRSIKTIKSDSLSFYLKKTLKIAQKTLLVLYCN